MESRTPSSIFTLQMKSVNCPAVFMMYSHRLRISSSYVFWVTLQSLVLRMSKNGVTRLSVRLVSRGFILPLIHVTNSSLLVFTLDRLARSNICRMRAAFTSCVSGTSWWRQNANDCQIWMFMIKAILMPDLFLPALLGKGCRRKHPTGNP